MPMPDTMHRKATLIWIAPTPPPYMGPSIATEILLHSRFVEEFKVIHIDTADRRSLQNMGRYDLTNFLLAFKHYLLLLRCLVLVRGVDLVYIPISQTAIGYLRDAVFIVMAWLFRKKVVLHLRGGYFRQFYEASHWMMRGIVRRTLLWADCVIVLGQSLRHIFDGLVPEEKIAVVPNGRDLPSTVFQEPRDNDEGMCVLFLSNLVETKGFKDVLYAAKDVVQRRRDVKFVFAGAWMNGTDKEECKVLCEREGLENNVDFRGIVAGEDKIRLLREADVFVFPTYFRNEGHPWAIVEAMAAGLPIISTDHGCIRESVQHGDNGFIIPKKCPEAVAETILYLVDHPEVRQSLGRRSRELYEANFTQERFVKQMIDAMHMALYDMTDDAHRLAASGRGPC